MPSMGAAGLRCLRWVGSSLDLIAASRVVGRKILQVDGKGWPGGYRSVEEVHRQIGADAQIWGRLIDDLAAAGQHRGDLDPRLSQLLIMGTLNWTAEWWDPAAGLLTG